MRRLSRQRADAAVTALIVRWCDAVERAGRMRSTSALLAEYCDYGCQIDRSSVAPDTPLCGIARAEKPLRYVPAAERRALLARYGAPVARVVGVEAGGVIVDRVVRYWAPWAAVARSTGCSVNAAVGLVKSGRAAVRRALMEDRDR